MKNLLNISSLNKTDFDQIINFAKELDINNDSCLSNKNIGLIFEKIQHEQGSLSKSVSNN